MAWGVLWRRGMDAVIFGAKRAYYATLRYAWPLAAKFGITPARFDVLRCIAETQGRSLAQDQLRRTLCVARSTLSRMLRALEELGLVQRTEWEFDGRTWECSLTEKGLELVHRMKRALIKTKMVERDVDRALVTVYEPGEVKVQRKIVRSVHRRLCQAFAWRFGSPDAYWGVDDDRWLYGE
jgi:DNA-binding MarR family transcriptional regulator